MPRQNNIPALPPGLLKGISRKSLEQNDLTIEYLEAGIDLIMQALDHDPSEGVHPFLSWLSQRAVCKAVTDRGYLRGALGTLRDRWQPHADYLSDLLAWIRHRRAQGSFPVSEADRINAALGGHASSSQIIRGLSREVQKHIVTNPLFRLQLVGLAALGSPKYRRSREYARGAPELYEYFDDHWLPHFHEFLRARELELRPGIAEHDLVEVLIAVGEGLALREMANPTTGSRRERRLRLQGTVALALMYACVDPGDSLTLDQAVDQRHPS